jgi:DeoR family transcriptional regulator, suf operon transcriptional repressor
MKSTREKIIHTLLVHPQSSIFEIASAVDIITISVRHHLSSLQADGLVVDEEERHGVGRPRLVYSLTEKGMEGFPTNYLRLTNRLLDQLNFTLPEPAVTGLFAKMGIDLGEMYLQKAKNFTNLEEKLNFVQELLENEGFTTGWEKHEQSYQIHENSCPYFHIGQNHPEVCAIDEALISTVLMVPVKKINCILQGDNQCTYLVSEGDFRNKAL